MVYAYYQGVRKDSKGLFAALLGTVLALAAGLLLVVAPLASAATVVTVSGDTATGENQPGWLFNRDATTSTPFVFSFNEASVGRGSLYVEPIANTNTSGLAPSPGWDKFIAEYFYLDSVERFSSFSYDFLIGSGGSAVDANEFYLNVYTNLPGQAVDNFYDCRFDYVPAAGSTDSFETFTIHKSSVPARVQSRGGAACPAASEGLAGLPAGATIRAFALNVGDTSAQDTGLDGYLDNVVLERTESTTVYDSEPAPATKDACKRGGWELYGFRNQGQCVRFVVTGKDSR